MSVCWASFDPVRRKVDIYPGPIASRIEKAYGERDIYAPGSCVLGSDFFNATVNFHPNGSSYQTTLGFGMGRMGYKQPGYRSVKRFTFDEQCENPTITIFCKQVQREWRITNYETEAELTFIEQVPPSCLVEWNSTQEELPSVKAWTEEDLTSEANNSYVCVWQWCRGVPENEGNVLSLGDDWWCPYMLNNNQIIEEAYGNGANNVNITLPAENGERVIMIEHDNMYAKQCDEVRHKMRLVRRVVITVAKLQEMFNKMKVQDLDIDELLKDLPEGTIPHQFCCCISQDLMRDPVKTVDDHTYDKHNIERWFQHNDTSPLTGLHLSSMTLMPHTELKQQIDAFLENLAQM
jgi:hypothetical protein